MKYTQGIITAIAFLFVSSMTIAQDASALYVVKIGQFVNAKSSSFDKLKQYGYVYAVKEIGNVKTVYVGGIKGQAAANKVVAAAKSNDYIDAEMINLSTADSEIKTFIQLGLQDATQKIDWKRYKDAGRLFALLNGNQLKVLAGPYPTASAAKAILPTLKRRGFADAFVKNVSSAFVHEVTSFEGSIFDEFEEKLPVPIADKKLMIKGSATKAETKAKVEPKPDTPQSYDMVEAAIVSPPPAPAVRAKRTVKVTKLEATKPVIRSSEKRTAVLELQKILKGENVYTSSLDGFYGKGTKAAFTKVFMNNRQLKKYRALSHYNAQSANSDVAAGSLQYAINGLWDDSRNALLTLERSASPVAKVYRAYYMYENGDSPEEIDRLMNEAIKEAFIGKKLSNNAPKFDYSATYSYRDVKQLLKHMSYVQSVSPERTSVPCWMFERYEAKAIQIFGTAVDTGNIDVQDCGGFIEWEEVQMLSTIATDMSAGSATSPSQEAAHRAKTIRLFLSPIAPSEVERQSLQNREAVMLSTIEGWAATDPTLGEMAKAFKLMYYQSSILLQDYYAEKGYNNEDAKALSLSVVQNILGTKLNRFIPSK